MLNYHKHNYCVGYQSHVQNLMSLSSSSIYTVCLSLGKYTPYFPVKPSYEFKISLNHCGLQLTVNFIINFPPNILSFGALCKELEAVLELHSLQYWYPTLYAWLYVRQTNAYLCFILVVATSKSSFPVVLLLAAVLKWQTLSGGPCVAIGLVGILDTRHCCCLFTAPTDQRLSNLFTNSFT